MLLHQDAEIVDPDFCAKARAVLSDPEVAIVGCAGALGVRNISWWEGMVTWASFSHRYEEMGGGDIPGLSWHAERAPSYAVTGEVDAIDGFIIVMSPWAVSELRFDESLGLLHGYDLDICLQARAAGKKVVTTDFRAIHHHSLDLIGDQEAWVAAHMRIAEKWEDMLDEGTRATGSSARGAPRRSSRRCVSSCASPSTTSPGSPRTTTSFAAAAGAGPRRCAPWAESLAAEATSGVLGPTERSARAWCPPLRAACRTRFRRGQQGRD